MRTNLLREKWALDRPLFGVFLSFPSPQLVEFFGIVGYDWVLIDGEHGGVSAESCYALVTAADRVNMATVVQAPVNSAEVLLGYADAGVGAVIAPHVTSAAAAEKLVSALRYPPRGTRGVAAGSRAANYGLTQRPEEYFASPEATPVAAALLEDRSAYEDLEAIAATDGLEMCCIGSGDLAASLGVPGRKDDPRVQELIRHAVPYLSSQGKIVEMAAGNVAEARDAVALGARMVQVPASGLLATSARAFLDGVAGDSAGR